ncbi:hypothetical protein EV363DRAFT_1393085 [Boletus edulis]|nr:hypothetical protein EV363DRAFT_1393085 [Boletus edulis]
MARATSSASIPGRPALRRNQACRSCRKRKLWSCHSHRVPFSSFCRQWQSLISVPAPPGYAHPAEPQCVYDPVDGLALAPDTDPIEKIRMLEEEVSKLKIQLQQQSSIVSPLHHNQAYYRPASTSSISASSGQTSATGNKPLLHSIKDASALAQVRQDSSSPDQHVTDRSSAEAVLELMYSGWNPDLPEPYILNHYIEVFFKCDPCGPRILHRPSFLSAMRLHPRDPGFPHFCHSPCHPSRWSSRNVAVLPDGSRRDEFAEYHANKTRQYIDKTMATGEDIFHVVQACILLSWYFYQEGRWVEIWIFAGFQTRVAGTFSIHDSGSPGGYLPPPRDFRDLETRRRTWWMSVVFDRIVSIGGWIHAIDEQDIGTELPLRGEDFDSEQLIPNNPQDMCSEDIFTTHLPRYTDSFLLLIKAVMMFGRVTDFNVRGNLRAPTAPSKHQDPFALPGFSGLDSLVHHDFLENLPHIYRFNIGVTDVSGNAQCSTITLHNPYMDLNDLQRVSTNRCIKAAQAILSAYFMLSATSLDVTRLHPFVTICWYLAAVVQVQVCRHFIETGDYAREAQVWGEINVLRCAMLNYGTRSPIGIRQEKLLQALMKEIVRLTTQRKPLEVGLPLYPFSHTTLFASPVVPPEDAPIAPLPNPSTSSQFYNSALEMCSGSVAFSTVPSPLYCNASSVSDEVHTGIGESSVAWNYSE